MFSARNAIGSAKAGTVRHLVGRQDEHERANSLRQAFRETRRVADESSRALSSDALFVRRRGKHTR